MESILLPVLILGGLALLFGLILAWASKQFAVAVDPRVTALRAALPGANCGACGQTGCDAFAEALAAGSARIDGCPVGGEATTTAVAAVLGVEPTATVAYVARVHCGGAKTISKAKYEYAGVKDCVAAAALHGGPLACTMGCVGFGNCAKACPFGAIVLENGLARIVEEKCKACEKCVVACPKKLIEMVPRGKEYAVACKSTDRGPIVRKNCEVGCIGCGKCVKVCPKAAITMDNNLAKIDPLTCQNCGDCLPVCPTGAIRRLRPGMLPVTGKKTATAV